MTELAKIIDVNNNSFDSVLHKNNLFNVNWYFRNQLFFKKNLFIIKNKYYLMNFKLINNMIKDTNIKQEIFVFKNKNQELI